MAMTMMMMMLVVLLMLMMMVVMMQLTTTRSPRGIGLRHRLGFFGGSSWLS